MAGYSESGWEVLAFEIVLFEPCLGHFEIIHVALKSHADSRDRETDRYRQRQAETDRVRHQLGCLGDPLVSTTGGHFADVHHVLHASLALVDPLL